MFWGSQPPSRGISRGTRRFSSGGVEISETFEGVSWVLQGVSRGYREVSGALQGVSEVFQDATGAFQRVLGDFRGYLKVARALQGVWWVSRVLQEISGVVQRDPGCF